MKLKNLFIGVIALSALIMGCEKNETPLGVSLDNAYFAWEGAEQSFVVNTTAAWTATCDADWVTITPASGQAGQTKVTISSALNPTAEKRNAVVIVKADGATDKELDVFQNPKVFEFGVSAYSVEAGARETSGTFGITGNSNWKIECPAGVTANPASGFGEAEVTLTFPKNSSKTDNLIQEVHVITEDPIVEGDKDIKIQIFQHLWEPTTYEWVFKNGDFGTTAFPSPEATITHEGIDWHKAWCGYGLYNQGAMQLYRLADFNGGKVYDFDLTTDGFKSILLDSVTVNARCTFDSSVYAGTIAIEVAGQELLKTNLTQTFTDYSVNPKKAGTVSIKTTCGASCILLFSVKIVYFED